MLVSIVTVSYTHLDVYKRQPLDLPVNLSVMIVAEVTVPA